jgi:hypothetical protein
MLVRALKLQLTGGEALVGALQALVTQKWSASVVNGQTILSTSEADGSVTFTFDRAYTPAELATMAEEALEWVNTLVDPRRRIGFRRSPKPCRSSSVSWHGVVKKRAPPVPHSPQRGPASMGLG